jgi:hypothetical protein
MMQQPAFSANRLPTPMYALQVIKFNHRTDIQRLFRKAYEIKVNTKPFFTMLFDSLSLKFNCHSLVDPRRILGYHFGLMQQFFDM